MFYYNCNIARTNLHAIKRERIALRSIVSKLNDGTAELLAHFTSTDASLILGAPKSVILQAPERPHLRLQLLWLWIIKGRELKCIPHSISWWRILTQELCRLLTNIFILWLKDHSSCTHQLTIKCHSFSINIVNFYHLVTNKTNKFRTIYVYWSMWRHKTFLFLCGMAAQSDTNKSTGMGARKWLTFNAVFMPHPSTWCSIKTAWCFWTATSCIILIVQHTFQNSYNKWMKFVCALSSI